MSSPAALVLHIDVVGAARLAGKIGRLEAQHAVDRCLKRVERSVLGAGGTVGQCVAGQMVAGFPAAEAAWQGTLEMLVRVEDLPPVSGIKLDLQLGLCAGPLDDAAVVERAGRLADVCVPGRVALDSGTRALLSAEEQEQLVEVAEVPSELAPVYVFDPEAGEPAASASPLAATTVAGLNAASSRTAAPRAATPSPAASSGRFCVRYRGKAYLLDSGSVALMIGRGNGNDVIVADSKVSRSHARIERRDDGYVLVDQSTNGTYLVFAGDPELFLRREEIVLRGAGQLAFGHSTTIPGVEVVTFEHL
ncbi:hypothetical protein OTERR_30730 [Oryzomicrobium terrae]|uniref:FHA domain-containing protein n=1 Tax=Oryzomicrobium terrae TaxID=1735038 RepID=A0A5C1ED67_9RHOO|nr:FHA domain-containing protein [Oryzomicrobium terrae]QEL66549.1 hypothetical protein OTERR_30730 [Oryzomicrobium terrae]